MAIVFVFVSIWLLSSQVQHCEAKSAREILPDYIRQIMERIIQPVFLAIVRLRQMKIIADERGVQKDQDEHCDVLFDELELEVPFINQAYKVMSKLAGYLSLYTIESKKCETRSAISALTCYLHIGRHVTDTYSIYESTAVRLLDQLQEIDAYVSHLIEGCFVGGHTSEPDTP
uniref:Putative secreted protein n=1 Tax=Panstrongylus lignarius TaxID=156445 RepID=A0A224XUS0_9HEMI